MRISDWSSDVCSSDLILCYRSVVREKSVPTFSHEALEARAVDLLERQRIEIDARHAAQVDRADLAAIWPLALGEGRSEEHTSELQSLMRISYAVFCLKKKNIITSHLHTHRFSLSTH